MKCPSRLPIVTALLAALSAHASPPASALKAAPARDTIHFEDYMRFAGVAGYRALDWHTTEQGIRLGCRENVLPKAVVQSSGRLAAFEGLATVGEIAGSVYLVRHGHRRIAQTMDYLSIGGGMLIVSVNVHAIHTAESQRSKLVQE